MNAQPLAARWVGDHLLELGGEPANVGGARLVIDASGLDLCEVEHVVDQVEQVRAAGRDRVERFAMIRRQRAVALQQLRVAEDAVQRRPELVAHVGEELALRLRRRFGRFLGAPQLFLALGEPPDRRLTGFVGDGGHHQVGDREREVLLVDGPRPRFADVLDAQDADRRRLAFVQRHVQHRADSERRQIVHGHLAGCRVALGVIRDDDAVALQGREVRRRGGARQNGARLVLPGRIDVEVGAQDRVAAPVEFPHAGAIDAQRPGRCFEQLREPRLEARAAARLVRGQPRERGALLREPLFAGAQRLFRKHLIGDVREARQDGGLAGHRDERGRCARPVDAPTRLAEAEQDVVGAPVFRQPLDEGGPLTRVHVELGDPSSDDVGRRNLQHGGGLGVDGDDAAVGEPADDSGKGSGVEELPVGEISAHSP